jgi:thimet oligopeptidase
VASTFRDAHPDASWQAAARDAQQQLNAFMTTMSLDRRVYDGLAGIKNVPPDAKHYVERTLADSRRAGVMQPEDVRKQIAATQAELVKLEQKYAQNLASGRRELILNASDLDNLPADFLKSHPKRDDGTVAITNDAADVQPVLSYATNPEVRRRAQIHAQTRGAPANEPVVRDLIRLRHQLAKLCGFPNYAAYAADSRMIGTVERHRSFIQQLDGATKEVARRELAELLAAKRKDDPSATSVNAEDTQYYGRLVRESKYKLDSRRVRQYFPYNTVKEAVLRTSAEMFGLSFEVVHDVAVWHPSVEVYNVRDGDRLIGRFYLDMHPRPNKYQHFRSGSQRFGVAGRQLSENTLICNFPNPANGPALLNYGQARTFFHEFGHLLHGIFAGHRRWAGAARAEGDFMEAPSQLLEEWLSSPDVLVRFTRHYETGEPMPVEMARTIIAAESDSKGLRARGGVTLAAAFLDMHDDPEPMTDPSGLFETHYRRMGMPFQPGGRLEQNISHIGNRNYAAAYYTYAWSEVIAKDLFTRFDRGNLLARDVARHYRVKVLEPGGTKPAAELIADFLGRPLSIKAYEAWLSE